jgi:hypothetical protein
MAECSPHHRQLRPRFLATNHSTYAASTPTGGRTQTPLPPHRAATERRSHVRRPAAAYRQRSIVVSINRIFAYWNEVLPSAACVVALVERLVHDAEIVSIERDSYRPEEAGEKASRRSALGDATEDAGVGRFRRTVRADLTGGTVGSAFVLLDGGADASHWARWGRPAIFTDYARILSPGNKRTGFEPLHAA